MEVPILTTFVDPRSKMSILVQGPKRRAPYIIHHLPPSQHKRFGVTYQPLCPRAHLNCWAIAISSGWYLDNHHMCNQFHPHDDTFKRLVAHYNLVRSLATHKTISSFATQNCAVSHSVTNITRQKLVLCELHSRIRLIFQEVVWAHN